MDEFNVDHSVCRRLWRKGDTARCWSVARKFVWGVSLAIACQCALAQAMYRIKPLGYLGGCASYAPQAAGLNGSDEVTGGACNGGEPHAFLWKNNGTPMVDVGPPGSFSISDAVGLTASGMVAGSSVDNLGDYAFLSSGDGTLISKIYDSVGGNRAQPTAVNDLGQLTGYAYLAGDTAARAFVWKNDGSSVIDLGTLGGDSSYGYGINLSGQVAGSSYPPGTTLIHAFVWKNDGTPMLDLGSLGGGYSQGFYINATGQVAGSSTLPTSPKNSNGHAFLWRNDGAPMQDLGTLGGAESDVHALNDSGQVAGSSYKFGRKRSHAFAWMNDGTPMKDLGTLGGTLSNANDMNSSGQVTGWANLHGDAVSHAFLWRNDGTKIQDLNKLIDPTDPLQPYITLTKGDFVNDLGDILAEGTDSRTGLGDLYLLQGTVLTLSPRSLAFGNQAIKTSSTAKSVTMTNTSAKVVAITSIALKGVAAGQFASTNNCGKSLAGHATCTIKVTFTPTTKGAKSATLNVNGGGGSLRVANLTGTGT